jgi:alkylresorcinol/alkylpyrone synthase
MHAAGLEPAGIGGLVINTCTGYLCPGLTSYVSEQLGLDRGVKVFDLMGMGCGGAIPNIECAAGIIARNGGRPVISIAVEICSATMYLGPDPDLVISNSIFGDGAAAAIVDAPDGPGRTPVKILDFETGLYPRHREDLRYRTENGRLRNVLSKRVPLIGAKVARETACRLLDRHGLSIEQIDFWAVHPGGTLVLEQIGEKLGLSEERLRFSYEIFSEYGNMSSPSVLFVLKRLLCQGKPQPGQKGLMLAFGAGFSAYAALVEF